MSILNSFYQDQQSSYYEQNTSRVNEFKSLINKNSKSFLLNFPSIPFSREIFGCYEANSEFNYGFSPEFDVDLLRKHELPECDQIVDILAETHNHTQIGHSYLVSQTHRQPIFRKLLKKYFESGICAVLEELNSFSLTTLKKNKIPEFIAHAAGAIVKLVDIINAPVNPLFIKNKDELNVTSILGESWKSSLIKSLAWHPHSNKLAVAFKNDLVKIYSPNNQQVVLKHQKQIDVTCLAWKPFYTSMIAIGCKNCIIIWDTDVLPVSIKPSSSCSFALSKRYHSDIVDLEWYPKSDFLLSVSSRDNQIMIWDVTLKECMPIKRIGTCGYSIARFSPNGFKLFTADLSTTFRIWNPINYSSEKWTNLITRCNSACWSPDESILLFSCDGCSLLYCLRFLTNNKQELQIVCDLSTIVQCDATDREEIENMNLSSIPQTSIGGSIRNISWDPTGQRLAVTFKKYDNDSYMNVVAVFITKFQPEFQILPCGFVNNTKNSLPTSINFKPYFEPGALLTIGWSNGHIQHIPFYFAKIVDDYMSTNMHF